MTNYLIKPSQFILTLFLVLSFSLQTYSQALGPCEDPDTFTTLCGTVFDLCIDYEELGALGYVDIYVDSNDDVGLFQPCDLKLPTDTNLLPKHGTVAKLDMSGECFMRYTLTDLNYTGLDSFDYLLNHIDTCNIPTDYCPGGKIWTMNCAYFGESGAAVTVTAKQGGSTIIFATIYNLQDGEDFFINGKGLATNQTEWTFRFYSGGDLNNPPFSVAPVHTSCSQPIFGINFGVFRPISGCVAPKKDKDDCTIISQKSYEAAQYRSGHNQVDVSTDDTTRVFVLIIESGALPIDFTSIMGRAVKENNLISWQISAVIGEEKMILQKSSDGRNFMDLTYYTDLAPGEFQFLDTKVTSKRSFYRFKMISFNGDESFSRSITIVNREINSEVQMFPSPTSDIINFRAGEKIVYVEIINLAGQRVFAQAYDSDQLSLNLRSHLENSGIFIARITLESGTMITKKINLVD